MKTHYKKILPQYFEDVINGNKPFELRVNDCNYKVGDTLVLKEFKPKINEEFTGREISKEITYVLYGGQYGLDKDYCILGLKHDCKEKEVYLRAINTFGQYTQMVKAMEECGELIRALSRIIIDQNADVKNVCEEIADVEIMLCQLRLIFSNAEIDHHKKEKLERLKGVVW
ncbi:DUF3850 domain-containing protein [Clostridium sp.]|uniref:DUF3850 domain-containing protein n=1 Tax=Clostridium sp. TaxID=1506 RepID=UPI00284DC14D|nr:DUF3850 domain-containing protein [Clostridium sp.]MDR3595131.1 DUF3850 domain-containing protein [Clostridium sp.]